MMTLHPKKLFLIGEIYFLGEIGIIVTLAVLELRASSK